MTCLVCRAAEIPVQLDVGAHPVSSFFLPERQAAERRFPLQLGQCPHCATIQLRAPLPAAALVPPYDWLSAREPEEHLDAVVEQIVGLPGLTKDAVVAGLTAKDDTTLERFRARGFSRIWRVDLKDDLGIDNPACAVETVQAAATPQSMREVARRRGLADIFIVRHVLEHAEDLHRFVHAIAAVVRPGGIVMVEVPDCANSLKLNDYAMVWEEHSLYLTPGTFAPILGLAGFEDIRTDVYPLPFENSLVQLARKTGQPRKLPAAPDAAEIQQFKSYAAAFEPTTRQLRARLENWRRQGPIALYGAGHLACAFVNFHGLADLIDFVADDTPQKQGLFLPGARIPILPSGMLVERGVKLCLLALSIGNEDKVIARNDAFAARGGVFRSIFAASGRTIHEQYN